MMTNGEPGQATTVEGGRMVAALLEGARPRVVIKGDVAIAEMPDGRVERYQLIRCYPCREPEEEEIGPEQAAA